MDCLNVRAELFPYQLDGCDDDLRELLEAHLIACQGCLRACLLLKRAVEAPLPAGEGASDAARPSQVTRLRLRAEVARTFRYPPGQRLRQLLGRPMPLYQATAAAVLLLLIGLLPALLRPAEAPRHPGRSPPGRRRCRPARRARAAGRPPWRSSTPPGPRRRASTSSEPVAQEDPMNAKRSALLLARAPTRSSAAARPRGKASGPLRSRERPRRRNGSPGVSGPSARSARPSGAAISARSATTSCTSPRCAVCSKAWEPEGEKGGGWSKLLDPTEMAELRTDMRGEIVGIGIDVKEGDKVLTIDGKRYQGRTLRDVVAAIRGKAGEEVTLLLRGADLRTVKVRRARVPFDMVSHQLLDGGVGYVQIRAFVDGTLRSLRAAFGQLGGARALVLDLRGNQGGLLEKAIESAELLLPGGGDHRARGEARRPGGALRRQGRPGAGLHAPGHARGRDDLVGGRAARGGAARGQGAAVLGQRTLGKWSAQMLEELENGYAIQYTSALFRTAAGRSYDGEGLQPDVEVPWTRRRRRGSSASRTRRSGCAATWPCARPTTCSACSSSGRDWPTLAPVSVGGRDRAAASDPPSDWIRSICQVDWLMANIWSCMLTKCRAGKYRRLSTSRQSRMSS